MGTTAVHSKKRICYYYDSDIGNYYYGQGHPMKPHRIRMTHNLLLNYGLYRKMEIYRPHKATQEELTKFHSDDYIRFLRSIRPDNMGEYNKQMQRFNVGEDCPVFDGLYEFCQLPLRARDRRKKMKSQKNKKQLQPPISNSNILHCVRKATFAPCDHEKNRKKLSTNELFMPSHIIYKHYIKQKLATDTKLLNESAI